MTALLHWILFILWLFWVVTYWVIPYLFKMHSPNVELSKSFQDIATIALLGLALGIILFSIVATTLFNMPSVQFGEPWLDWTGLLLTSLGFVGMYWGRSSMGRLWLPETGLKREHRVVDHGLYGIVRHPIYTFVVVFCLGSILMLPSWWNWTAFLAAVVGYIRKVLEEEAFLAAHLPGYIEYQHRVRYRLIPRIW